MQEYQKKRATIVTACFLIQAVGVGTYVSFGVLFNPLIEEFNWSRGAISGASSLALFLSGLLAVLIGRLNDIYGPKKLMGIAALFFGMGLMLMSQVDELWQLYLFYGIVFGIGLSGVDIIALTTTARWFSRSRGIMTGIVKVGTGAGQFIIPFLTGMLIAAFGWRVTNVVLGLAGLIILSLLAKLLRKEPEDGGVREADTVPQKSRRDSQEPELTGLGSLLFKDAIRSTSLWIICGVNLLLVFTLMIILVHLVPHANDLGHSSLQSAGLLSTIGAVSMLGRFVSGITIDKTGSRFVMVVCYFVLISALLWLQIAQDLWALYLFAAVYGVAHGGFFTAISPIVAETFGTASHGAIFGVVIFSGTTGGALGPIVAGLMFDTLGRYTEIFWIIVALSVIGLFLITLLQPINKANRAVC